MKNNEINFPPNFYDEHLITLNDIKFTPREIDIITFILHTRGTSKIASFLSISPRTVESHTANIMRKMDCNSREGIIDFVHKSGKSSFIRKHYQNLLIQRDFKKRLEDVSALIRNTAPVCYLIYEGKQKDIEYFLQSAKKYLSSSGIKVILEEKTISIHEKPQHGDHIIYVMSQDLLEQFQADKNHKKLEISKLTQKALQNPGSLTFLFPDKNVGDIPSEILEIGYISLKEQGNYYLLIFEILKRILRDKNFDKIVSEFKKHDDLIYGAFEKRFSLTELSSKEFVQKENILAHIPHNILKNKRRWLIVGSVFFIIFLFLGFLIFSFDKVSKKSEISSPHSIRSDLVVPTESTFLNRPDVIGKIEENFKENGREIQTVALIGTGGAGKTTLARQYARQQNASVVWEINTETQESLKDSFERLAYVLCKSEEEKRILRGLQDIKNSMERDEKILLFVKERLKAYSNWFLIYDNIEKFTDIQRYFPYDSNLWGNGQVILTTRDSHIKNNSYINNTIQIGELNPKQKLILFMKIMTNGDTRLFTSAKTEETKTFLKDIPPFPLDISIAAYYLKATNISYAKYLEYLKEYGKDFAIIQEDVIKEASDYLKTRYSIVTLSLKKLIDTHKDFSDILLFISLLDSQNIPRILLDTYKNDIIVDNFIYHLKKYSLITSESSTQPLLSFSIHRNTQEISFSYLVKTLSLEKNNQLLHTVADTLENYITDIIDKEDFSRMKLLVTHCEAFLNHNNLLTGTTRGSVGSALGCIYYYQNHTLKAKQLLEESLADLNQCYEKNHNKIARVLVYLGNVYRELGNCEKAKDLLEKSLVIYKKHSTDYAGTARALGYLGIVYRGLGNYKEAKNLLEQSLIIYEKHAPNHIGHAWILAHLGNTYMILGDYKKAKNLLEQSLIIYKKYSEDHVGASWVLGYLGDVYRNLGDYKKAKSLLEQSLVIKRKHFSENHVYVASSLTYLANLYKEIGDYQKAKSLFKQSLLVYEGNYGKDHVETARVLSKLAEAYLLEGDLETSESLINQSLRVFQQKKPSESYVSFENLAELYLKKSETAVNEQDIKRAQNFKKQAIQSLKKALEIIRDYFQEESPHNARIQSKLRGIST